MRIKDLNINDLMSNSFLAPRDNNNNILSISSSDLPGDNINNFLEIKIDRKDESYLLDLIDINFTELVNDSSNLEIKIPENSILISQSEYIDLQNAVINLKEDLISTASLFENELDIAVTENTALVRTVQTIKDASESLIDSLCSKYRNNENVYYDLITLRSIFSIPFNDIITKNGQLSNRTRYYLDVSSSVSMSFGNNNHPDMTFYTIHRTEVSYSLAFDDNYLVSLFQNQRDILQLLDKINNLHYITASLQNEIIILKDKLRRCRKSGGIVDGPITSYGEPGSDVDDFNYLITTGSA